MGVVGRVAVTTAPLRVGVCVWAVGGGSTINKAQTKKVAKKKKAQLAITKAMKKMTKKPAAWLKKRPTGCSKCRNIPGCTLSCWNGRGGPP